jgi:hypothetical protein
MKLTKISAAPSDGERLSHELVTVAMDFAGPDRFAILNLGESSIMRGGTEFLQPPSLAPDITRCPADPIDVTAGERVPGMVSPFNASGAGGDSTHRHPLIKLQYTDLCRGFLRTASQIEKPALHA